jgi:hypothetical protein
VPGFGKGAVIRQLRRFFSVGGDRRPFRLLILGKLRQCTQTLGRSLRKTLGCRIAGVLEVTFRAFGPSSICFYRMHDPTHHLIKTFSREIRCSRRVKKTYLASDDQNVQVAQYA